MTSGQSNPMSPKHVFPVYRRSADSRHFYCIEGEDRFVEVQRIGSRRVLHQVQATQYPERLRIQEMIDGAEGRWLPVERGEWLAELEALG